MFYKYNLTDKNIIILKVHLNLTTKKVLVMDFIEGTELKNIKAPNKKIADKIVKSLFKQMFLDGFFHGDPHPANIIVVKNKIAFIDCGIMGRFTPKLRRQLFSLFIATINRNGNKMAET